MGMSRLMKRLLKRDLRSRPGGVKGWRQRQLDAARVTRELNPDIPGAGRAHKSMANAVQ